MRKILWLVVAVLGVLALLGTGSKLRAGDQSNCCSLTQEALKASGSIKSGMTRHEVELNFRPDGGVQVRDVTRYVYRGCVYIRVDIHFKLAKPTDAIKGSPDDIVTKVSTPYLAYPTID